VVVAPERKLHATIYGDSIRMDVALSSLGYHYGHQSEWYGLRLRKLMTNSLYLCPWLDMASSVREVGEYLMVSSSGMSCNNTSGVIGGTRCDSCEDFYNAEEEGGHVRHVGDLCGSCMENYFYCDGCSEYRHTDCEVCITTSLGDTEDRCESCAPPECRDCSERHEDHEEIDGEDYCPDCAEKIPRCADCEQHIVPPLEPTTCHGDPHCEACAADHAVDEEEVEAEVQESAEAG
jgi:hypothetical protein